MSFLHGEDATLDPPYGPHDALAFTASEAGTRLHANQLKLSSIQMSVVRMALPVGTPCR